MKHVSERPPQTGCSTSWPGYHARQTGDLKLVQNSDYFSIFYPLNNTQSIQECLKDRKSVAEQQK